MQIDELVTLNEDQELFATFVDPEIAQDLHFCKLWRYMEPEDIPNYLVRIIVEKEDYKQFYSSPLCFKKLKYLTDRIKYESTNFSTIYDDIVGRVKYLDLYSELVGNYNTLVYFEKDIREKLDKVIMNKDDEEYVISRIKGVLR